MLSDVWNFPDNALLNSVANMVRARFNSSLFDMTGGTQAPAPLDPRTLGEGPCGQHHQVPEVFQCNQHACWRRCQRCSLRLEYHAKLNATGTSRSAGHTPEIVRRALELVHEANIGRDGMTCKKMDGSIKIAEGERMTGRTTTGTGRGRATTTTTSAPPDGGRDGGHSAHGGTGTRRRPNEDTHDGQSPETNGGENRDVGSASSGMGLQQASADLTLEIPYDGTPTYEALLEGEEKEEFEVIQDEVETAAHQTTPQGTSEMNGPSSSQEPFQAMMRRSLDDPLQLKLTSQSLQEPQKLTTIVEAAAPLGVVGDF